MVVLFRHVLILSSCFLATALVAFGEDAADFVKSGIERGQKHDYAGAVEDFSKAIALKPLSAELHTERGLAEGALIKKGDEHSAAMTDALDDYNTAIKLKPNFAPAYYNRGNLMQFEENWERAKADFKTVVELKPKPDYVLLSQAFLHLAKLAEREGNLAGARLYYAQAYFNRGWAKQRQRDWDGALADYSQTIDFDPDFFNYYNCRGSVKEEKGDWDGAIDDFDRAIKLKSDFSFAYYNRGHAKFHKGDLNGALVDYSKSIELNPKDADAFANRGIIKDKMGDANGSLADFRKAIELNPKKRDALKADGYSIGEINAK